MTQKNNNCTTTLNIKKYTKDGMTAVGDTVIVEYPLTIYINDQEWITLLCSGKDQYYLAIGFMFSEGIIKSIAEIEDWHMNQEAGKIYLNVKENIGLRNMMKGKRTVTTGCGKGTVFYDVLDALTTKTINNSMKIGAELIIDKAAEFQKKSQLFIETGGVHACALYERDKLVCYHEDIGRHNALDKVIGQMLVSNISLQEGWLLVSGRISSEIVIKASRVNIGLLASRSAPTNLAVEMAGKIQMTLIGFARGNRFNLYTGDERLLFNSKE